MNCRQVREIWDEHRDGELTTDQRQAFEAHLHECASCAALWEKETAWLKALAADEPPIDETRCSSGTIFTAEVLNRWADVERRAASSRVWPIRRWVAAAAAVLLIAAVVEFVRIANESAGPDEPFVVVIDGQETEADPLSVLLIDMTDQIQQQPQQLAHVLEQSASLLDFNRVADMLGLAPPAEDAEPAPRRPRG